MTRGQPQPGVTTKAVVGEFPDPGERGRRTGGEPFVGAAQAGRRASRGMVTAELAIGLVVVALVTLAAVFSVSVVIAHTRCADVAGQIAREVARGDHANEQRARALLPQGATAEVRIEDGWVTVTVRRTMVFAGRGRVPIVATASMPMEPGTSGSSPGGGS